MAGHVQARCLQCRPSRPRMADVQADLAHLLATEGRQPEQIQSDRAPCFLGAPEGQWAAVPGRLSLWLAGLGIAHRLLPARHPQQNGAVERFHGAIEHSWRAEADGVDALRRVWNVDKPALDAAHQPYRGRAGFRMAWVWALLATVRVRRRVDAQGKFGLWNRPVRVGHRAAGQEVTVCFDAARQRVIISDAHAVVLREVTLDWLSAEWLWEPVPLTDQAAHSSVTSTV